MKQCITAENLSSPARPQEVIPSLLSILTRPLRPIALNLFTDEERLVRDTVRDWVRERILPELDAEFFKSQQVDDLEGLKSQIRNNLKLQKEYQNRSSQRSQITEALAAKATFSAPESLVESETQSILRQFIEENMRRGVSSEQFEKDKIEIFSFWTA